MKKVIPIILTLLFSQSASGQASRRAAELVLQDINGQRFSLSDYKGKVVLLNFWATWCPPCRAEMPGLVRWQRKYRNRGLQVIGVTYPPNDSGEIRKFIRSIRVNYPIAMGTTDTKALFMEGETMPITVVIDRNQNIRETIEGILLPEEFEQKIKPLLKQSKRLKHHQRKLKQSRMRAFIGAVKGRQLGTIFSVTF
jgi:thiol-disulfide isomerase/thioredoxin